MVVRTIMATALSDYGTIMVRVKSINVKANVNGKNQQFIIGSLCQSYTPNLYLTIIVMYKNIKFHQYPIL